jgi:MFS family permease
MAYHHKYGHLTALSFGGILLAVNRTLIYPVLDRVAEDLGLSAAQAGFIASLYFVCLLVSQVALSFFGDRVRLKRVLVAAYIAAALAVLGLGLWAASYGRLLFFVGLQGLTMGIFWPLGYSLAVAGVPAGRRGQASALVGFGLAAGHGLGPALSGTLFQLTGGWRLPFALMAAPTLALAVAFVFLVQDAPPAAGARPLSWRPALRDPDLLKMFGAGFCTLYGLWLVTVWGPSFLQVERGLSLNASGLYIALVPAVAALAGLLMGPLSDRAGRRRLSVVLFALSAAALGLMAFAQGGWALLAILVLYGFVCKFAWDPVNIAWLADLTSRNRAVSVGQAVALASIIGMVSSVVGPVVNGWVRDQTGSLQGAFLLGAGLAAAGAVMCGTVKSHG